MSDFQKENRYLVFKSKDLAKIDLTPDEVQALNTITLRIDANRIKEGKPMAEYVVVESDWPMYDRVWAMIKSYYDIQQDQGKSP